jgi:ribosomal protein S18 acetylase RimI-like enzyme
MTALKDFEKQNSPTSPAPWWKNRQQGKSFELLTACQPDIPSLARLFSICFGDSPAEGDAFLRRFLPVPGFRLLYAAFCGQPVSMLSLIPACLTKEDGSLSRGFYLYGVGTLPAYRKQGLASSLIEAAAQLAASLEGNFLFLVPASDSLTAFYERQGFSTRQPFPKADPAPVLPGHGAVPLSPEAYCALRTQISGIPGVFSLQEPFFSYAVTDFSEHLFFYLEKKQKESAASAKSERALCFHASSGKEAAILLEAFSCSGTGSFPAADPSSGLLYGGLVHQVRPLGNLALPKATYFQFPMDTLFC